MKVPKVNKDICLAVSRELIRKGTPYLADGIEAITKEQPHLMAAMSVYTNEFVKTHGIFAAESFLRILVLQYKMIKTQFEVNELEEQGKL